MGRTLNQYDDRIRARLGDLGVLQHFQNAATSLALEAAINQFSNDHPREVTQTLTGDGSTYDFDLDTDADAGDEYINGWSRISLVEYPAGERDPEYLDEYYGWRYIYTSGTNYLRLVEDTPSSAETVQVTYTAPWPYPTDTAADDKIPAIFADAVSALAASILATSKATELAAQQSTSVLGQLSPTNPEPLYSAASALRKAYETTVLGRPDDAGAPPQIGYAESEIDVFPNAIFHGRHRG